MYLHRFMDRKCGYNFSLQVYKPAATTTQGTHDLDFDFKVIAGIMIENHPWALLVVDKKTEGCAQQGGGYKYVGLGTAFQ